MQRYASSMSPKGQITIPAEVRTRLGLKPKDRVEILVDGDEIRLAKPAFTLQTVYASVPPLDPPRTQEEIDEIIRDEMALKYAEKFGVKIRE